MSKIKDGLFEVLEAGLRQVIGDEKTTVDQKIQAINAGAKLLQIKHRLGDDGGGKHGSFFNK